MSWTSISRLLVVLAATATVVAMSSAAALAAPAGGPHHATAHHSTTVISRNALVEPLAASGCSGDACITLGTPYKSSSNWYVQVHGCAWKTSVYGHIHIYGPGGSPSATSSTKTWHATSSYCTGSDDAFVATFKNPPTGEYCSTTYSGSANDGTACETLDTYK